MDLEAPRYADSEADSISVDLSSTAAKLQQIVEKQLDLLMSGKITKLSKHTGMIMDCL